MSPDSPFRHPNGARIGSRFQKRKNTPNPAVFLQSDKKSRPRYRVWLADPRGARAIARSKNRSRRNAFTGRLRALYGAQFGRILGNGAILSHIIHPAGSDWSRAYSGNRCSGSKGTGPGPRVFCSVEQSECSRVPGFSVSKKSSAWTSTSGRGVLWRSLF